MLSINDFVTNWNAVHGDICAYALGNLMLDKPLSISVRYPAVKYQHHYHNGSFDQLRDTVEFRSKGLMIIESSEEAYAKGCVEILIATMNHNYKEEIIEKTLCWIGSDFFDKLNETATD